MEEHSPADHRSTSQSPECGEDIRGETTHKQRLWEGKAQGKDGHESSYSAEDAQNFFER